MVLNYELVFEKFIGVRFKEKCAILWPLMSVVEKCTLAKVSL